jgi:hypothetical protein
MQYAGTLRIIRVEPPTVDTPRTYVVTYAPDVLVEAEPGAKIPSGYQLKPHTAHGDENLIALLVGLNIHGGAIDRALEELHQQGSTLIAPVVLSDEELSRYGLQWTVGSKILSYLSALTR